MTENSSDVPTSDRLVDELLPADIEWRQLVRTYPLPAMALVSLAGFWIGRQHGSTIVAAFSSLAVQRATERASAFFDDAADS